MRKFLPAPIVGAAVVAVAGSILLTVPAQADQRYTAPKATVLSGDLASPWILQLRDNKAFQKTMQRNAMLLKRMEEQRQKRINIRPAGLARPALQPSAPAKKSSSSDMDPKFLPQRVLYNTSHEAGTIVIDTSARFLYLVEGNGFAKRYGVGVGREGFEWSGTQKISRKAEWPDWRPPEEMRARERRKGRELPVVMAGGPNNPLGARALYLGSTLYRIHGTNQPHTIGKAMSSGCIRMRNEDVTDLYSRVKIGTKVVVM